MTDLESPTDTPGKLTAAVRPALIEATIEQIMAGMAEMGLTPAEAQMVGELLCWQLLKNMMDLAQNPGLQDLAKRMAMRVALRLSGRIEAWPAENTAGARM